MRKGAAQATYMQSRLMAQSMMMQKSMYAKLPRTHAKT
jgi:hypothetical protein